MYDAKCFCQINNVVARIGSPQPKNSGFEEKSKTSFILNVYVSLLSEEVQLRQGPGSSFAIVGMP